MTIPGIGEPLGLTIASEIGDIGRFPTAGKLVGYSGLTARIKQSGQSSHVGRISKAGPTRCAGPPSRPPSRPGTSSRATSRSSPPRLARQPLARQAPPFVWPTEAHKRSEKPGQLPPDHLRCQAPKEISASAAQHPKEAPPSNPRTA